MADGLPEIGIGWKVPIASPVEEGSLMKCEIQGIKELTGSRLFYIHYIGLNRRYDRWVPFEEFVLADSTALEPPKKKKKPEPKTSQDEAAPTKIITDDELRIKNLNCIYIRDKCVEAWYFSPYPREIIKNGEIFLCEFCLYYFSSLAQLSEHAALCELRHPPGPCIYDDGELCFFELNGYIQKNYCRNLALLSKLFLDHKSLYYDIDVFMFYVLCRREESGYQIVGYFSKEKISEQGYNLACILTLPYEQRKGYGKILMDFSYVLSKRENRISGPEKPLSDLGLLSYRAYWLEVILEELSKCTETSIKAMSRKTHIAEDDILSTMLSYKMIKYYGDELIIGLDEALSQKMLKGRSRKINPMLIVPDY